MLTFDFNLWWQEVQNALIVMPAIFVVAAVWCGFIIIHNRRRR